MAEEIKLEGTVLQAATILTICTAASVIISLPRQFFRVSPFTAAASLSSPKLKALTPTYSDTVSWEPGYVTENYKHSPRSCRVISLFH